MAQIIAAGLIYAGLFLSLGLLLTATSFFSGPKQLFK